MLTLPRELRRRGRALPWWVAAVVVAALSGGCAHKSDAQAPGMEPGGGAEPSLASLELELQRGEERLQAAGVAVPGSRALATQVSGSSAGEEAGADYDADGAPEMEPARPAEPAAVEESVVTTGATSSGRERRSERRRCDDLCELTASICGLQDQICGLASRHPGEGRYAEVCERAAGDCRLASRECDVCR